VSETMGRFLERRRAELDLTQQELADKAGVPLPTLRNYLRDAREPLFSVGLRLAAAVGASPDELGACRIPKGGKDAVGKSKRLKGRPPTRKPKASD
jgi:transcriptional regulator with XRE-family HTH domain